MAKRDSLYSLCSPAFRRSSLDCGILESECIVQSPRQSAIDRGEAGTGSFALSTHLLKVLKPSSHVRLGLLNSFLEHLKVIACVHVRLVEAVVDLLEARFDLLDPLIYHAGLISQAPTNCSA